MGKRKPPKELTLWIPPDEETWEDMIVRMGMQDDADTYPDSLKKLHEIKEKLEGHGVKVNTVRSTAKSVMTMMRDLGIDPGDMENGIQNMMQVFESGLPRLDAELEECAYNAGFNPQGPMQKT